MSMKAHSSLNKVGRPPKDTNWIWLTDELIASPAWRYKSIHTAKLLEFLMIENMNHAGQENGNLIAPYNQLEKFGIGRQYISRAIYEAKKLGLIEVNHGGKKGLCENYLNKYRLTFLASKRVDEKFNSKYFITPTNEWKGVTVKEAEKITKGAKDRKIRTQVTNYKLEKFTIENYC